jgi:hypothetical protein
VDKIPYKKGFESIVKTLKDTKNSVNEEVSLKLTSKGVNVTNRNQAKIEKSIANAR